LRNQIDKLKFIERKTLRYLDFGTQGAVSARAQTAFDKSSSRS
jgi:hypothetical protein